MYSNSETMLSTLILVGSLLLISVHCDKPKFSIDYNRGTFLQDGKPFNYVSGSIHYARVHPALWYDRLYKMKFAGLNTIQVYVPWNFHETEKGQYNFTGAKDVEKFLRMAHDLELLVILRPGPYICAEWEFGGFPYWLIRDNASIALRTSDPVYLQHVSDWFGILLPRMRPLLYANGGPIISVQVENEYGSYPACDHGYLQYLLELNKKMLVDDVIFFTTDGDGTGFLKCGALNGTLTTVDFGAGSAKNGYRVLNYWNATFNGPYVNSEYYIGWLDIWGQRHAHVSSESAAATLDETLKMGANANMYMFHGGTNFGFTSGAPGDKPFNPVPTSYDYDAAISEAGDLTYKYYMLRNTIGKYKKLPTMDTPKNSTKAAYGKVEVALQAPIEFCASVLKKLDKSLVVDSVYPLRMELMNVGYGYLLYEHVLESDYSEATLSVPGIRDRGYVLVNNTFYGILYRDGPTSITIDGRKGDSLSILVENMGRVGYGSGITRGTKGIISNVTIGSNENITTWSTVNIKFDLQHIETCRQHRQQISLPEVIDFTPSIYSGVLSVPEPADTFIRLDNWFKGHVEINGYNIGRYWPVKGPQRTLYVPSALLNVGKNTVTVYELESTLCNAGNGCFIEFVDTPDLAGNVTSAASTMLFYSHHGQTDLH